MLENSPCNEGIIIVNAALENECKKQKKISVKIAMQMIRQMSNQKRPLCVSRPVLLMSPVDEY